MGVYIYIYLYIWGDWKENGIYYFGFRVQEVHRVQTFKYRILYNGRLQWLQQLLEVILGPGASPLNAKGEEAELGLRV